MNMHSRVGKSERRTIEYLFITIFCCCFADGISIYAQRVNLFSFLGSFFGVFSALSHGMTQMFFWRLDMKYENFIKQFSESTTSTPNFATRRRGNITSISHHNWMDESFFFGAISNAVAHRLCQCKTQLNYANFTRESWDRQRKKTNIVKNSWRTTVIPI